MAKKWYVVYTYSGYENRAKKALEERIKQSGLQEFFGEALVPTENVVETTKTGTKRTTKRKFFPGYMLVQMELNDKSWHLVRNTPKITGFVGDKTNPPSIPDEEVRRLTQMISEGSLQSRIKQSYSQGDEVRIIEGAFNGFNGTVDEVNEEKGRLRVFVSIFGRSTPVDLSFDEVEKLG